MHILFLLSIASSTPTLHNEQPSKKAIQLSISKSSPFWHINLSSLIQTKSHEYNELNNLAHSILTEDWPVIISHDDKTSGLSYPSFLHQAVYKIYANLCSSKMNADLETLFFQLKIHLRYRDKWPFFDNKSYIIIDMPKLEKLMLQETPNDKCLEILEKYARNILDDERPLVVICYSPHQKWRIKKESLDLIMTQTKNYLELRTLIALIKEHSTIEKNYPINRDFRIPCGHQQNGDLNLIFVNFEPQKYLSEDVFDSPFWYEINMPFYEVAGCFKINTHNVLKFIDNNQHNFLNAKSYIILEIISQSKRYHSRTQNIVELTGPDIEKNMQQIKNLMHTDERLCNLKTLLSFVRDRKSTAMNRPKKGVVWR